jgi:hypothetical protein
MGQITITLPDTLENEIREYVREKKYDSISDFVREIASQATSGRPSFWERVILVNLMQIKKTLGEEINDEMLDALIGGYHIFYPKSDQIAYEHEMSYKDMKFVMNVLDMYRWLQFSYKKLGIEDDKLAEGVKFDGFDANANDGYFSFTRFLVEHDRWTDVETSALCDNYNSHMPNSDIYQRMLDAYEKYSWKGVQDDISGPKALALDQLKEIIDARIHPNNRKDSPIKTSRDW